MGFLSKLKEQNRNFGSTMRRMNNRMELYGNVNRGIKGGDFWEGSYINIENGRGVIYGSNQDDYTFGPGDIKNSTFSGQEGSLVALGSERHRSLRFVLEFKDGKTAQMDIIVGKVDLFRASFGL